MSEIQNLIQNYERHIALPWKAELPGAQKIVFVIYHPQEERNLRGKMRDFESSTRMAKHAWHECDMTHFLPKWIEAQHKEQKALYGEKSTLNYHTDFDSLLIAADEIQEDLCSYLAERLQDTNVTENDVVAVYGVAGLFDILHTTTVLKKVEDSIRGRLLLFFPGYYKGGQYRFMDARDGFNYLGVPITREASYLPSYE